MEANRRVVSAQGVVQAAMAGVESRAATACASATRCQMQSVVAGMVGKRLMYRELIA